MYKNSSGTTCHLLLKRRSICYYSPHCPLQEKEFTYCEFGYPLDKLYKQKRHQTGDACVMSFLFTIGQFVLLRPQIGFLAPLSNARSSPPARLQLRRSYVRPMAARIVYRSICDGCVCPIDSTRLSRPAWHKLRLCCTRLFAARAIYRSICVTSPTNCPIHHGGCCRAERLRFWCLLLCRQMFAMML